MPEHATDEDILELIHQAQGGNAAAREQLILQYQPAARKVARKYYGLLGKDDARGVAALSLVQAIDSLLKKPHQRDTAIGIGGYVRQAVSFSLLAAVDDARSLVQSKHVHTSRRRLQKGQTVSDGMVRYLNQGGYDKSIDSPFPSRTDGKSSTLADTFVDPQPDPEAHYAKAEGRRVLRRLIEHQLPYQYADAIVVLYGLAEGTEPLSDTEAAERLGIPLNTLCSRRQRALKRLRTIPGLHEFLQLHAAPNRVTERQPVSPLPDGRQGKVQRRKNYKLTLAIAEEIRALWKTKQFRLKDLAARFNVSASAITHVVAGRTWKPPKKKRTA